MLSEKFSPTLSAQKQSKSLRSYQTKPELLLWKKLRAGRFHELKFRRQVPLGPYIVDFLCVQKKLIIEVDGDVHALKRVRDLKREKYFKSNGLRMLRFTNYQVKEAMGFVLQMIAHVTIHTPLPNPLPMGEGDLGDDSSQLHSPPTII